MAVTIALPGALREMAGGHAELTLDDTPATVGDAMSALARVYPAVYARVMTERGEIRRHVNVFVGDTEVRRTGGLGTALADGSEIIVIPSVSGG